MLYSGALLVAMATLVASPAAAQSASVPVSRTFASAADVQALIAKAKAVSDQPAVREELLSLAPYDAHLEYRTAATPARVHEKEAELFYVIDGSGTLLAGGTLKDSKRTDPTNLSGSAIIGGSRSHVAKGDFFIVPEGAPHQLLPDAAGALVLMSIHLPRPIGAH